MAFCVWPPLPSPFSLLYNIVCGPEFHISGICLRRRYTQAYLPAHRAAHHFGQTFLLSRNSSKKVPVLPALQPTPFYSSWLKGLNARCIVFYASSPFFASFSIILFTHSFTDFNGQEEIPEVASYPHSFSPQCSHTPARSKNLPNIEPHANRFLY